MGPFGQPGHVGGPGTKLALDSVNRVVTSGRAREQGWEETMQALLTAGSQNDMPDAVCDAVSDV